MMLTGIGIASIVLYMFWINKKKSNPIHTEELIPQKQMEESYQKTINRLIREKRWEDLEHLKTTFKGDYPHLAKKIEEALQDR